MAVEDLDRRLDATRWSDAVTNDWSYGTDRAFLQGVARYWREDYDWASRRRALNVLPQYRVEIDGIGIHVVHLRGRNPNGVPLLLMNGWPSSFVEFLRLIPLLVEGDPSFDVVIPAIPGFGYSDRPTRPNQIQPSQVFGTLMERLGYDRYMVAGTDVGAGVATRIAIARPAAVIAVHISAVATKPFLPSDAPKTEAEIAYEARVSAWMRDEGGYQAIQSSRPQTLAFGLADSPIGMASWILEKFRAWSDCGGDLLSVFPYESLADNLTIYWLTNTIGSSMRYYFDAARLRPALEPTDYVAAPTGIAMWPHDIALAPRELAERLYNVERYTVFPRGGHFPAWEAPELYAADLRATLARSSDSKTRRSL